MFKWFLPAVSGLYAAFFTLAAMGFVQVPRPSHWFMATAWAVASAGWAFAAWIDSRAEKEAR